MSTQKKTLVNLVIILLIGFIVPQNLKMPVKGATKSDYNSASFWYYPWGKSVTHKGVDIFAKKKTTINAATNGLVLYAGELNLGGKFTLILGPKWRLHYYAHLNEVNTTPLSFVTKESIVGSVGTSGNAAGKAPHLHYSIITLIPYLWQIDSSIQGWKKMFFLNPTNYLENR